MKLGLSCGATAVAVVAMTGAASAQQAATVAAVAKGTDSLLGKKVVIADCMMMSYNTIIGAQCSPVPLDPGALIYVDVNTLNAAGKKLGEDCNTTDINNFCLLKVTGDVAKDSRGQALIKNATLEMVKRVSAF
ncbi:MAG: hypothetical protein U1E56_02590 [Bauldia sp.]